MHFGFATHDSSLLRNLTVFILFALTHELIEFALGLFFRAAVFLLKNAEEFILATANLLPLVLGEFAPFLFEVSLYFVELAFDFIDIHENTPLIVDGQK